MNLLPRSLVGVLVTALLLVALPLLVALIVAMQSVERLSHSSLQVAVSAEVATQAGRSLLGAVVDMERYALQFLAVQERAFLDAYRERHVDFLASARDLRLSSHSLAAPDLDGLVERERALYDMLKDRRPAKDDHARIEQGFQELTRRARDLVEANSLGIWRSASALPQQAEELNRTLLRLTVVSVVITVALVALFAIMIHPPLRRLDRSIRDLGAGRLDVPIVIDHGSADLRRLGDRLDWLRVKLREIDSEKWNFLRNVSHELKTPLAAVREGAALLNQEVAEDRRAEQTQIAGIVLENSIRLQHLIENLLQLNAGRFLAADARRESFDLGAVVERVLDDHALARQAKALELEHTLPPSPMVGDPEQLRVVVDNLISNAVRFSPQGGTLRVSLRKAGSANVLDIQDEGPGIAAGEEGRIFDLFYRGAARGSGPLNGSGLGLAIARDFVEAHGGLIQSVSSNSGAHLRVTIPDTAPMQDG